MSSKSVAIAQGSEHADRGPLLGTLLRLSHREISQMLIGEIRAAGYLDIEAAHMTLLRPLWDFPGGIRGGDLAVAGRITKQSMSALIQQLEAAGYVERVDDPDDRRAKLVRLTRRGRKCGELIRSCVRRVEADWATRVGAERLALVKETLADLVKTFGP